MKRKGNEREAEVMTGEDTRKRGRERSRDERRVLGLSHSVRVDFL